MAATAGPAPAIIPTGCTLGLVENVYPPPANTLTTVTEPAFLKYSLTVNGTYVSLSGSPNLLTNSE